MHKVNCKANNYEYIKEEQYLLFFNSIFESNTWLILLASLLELLIPDKRSFNIPAVIEVKADENSIITISKDLKVSGSKEYRYFILKSHYRKWLKTYFISYCILIIAGLVYVLYFYMVFWEKIKIT